MKSLLFGSFKSSTSKRTWVGLTQVTLRCVGVIQLLFLIGQLYLTDVLLGGNRRTSTSFKSQKENKHWITSSNLVNHSTFNSEHNQEGLCIQLRNRQTRAPPITIINYGEIQLSIRFSSMLHRILAKCNTSFVVHIKLVEVEEREKCSE